MLKFILSVSFCLSAVVSFCQTDEGFKADRDTEEFSTGSKLSSSLFTESKTADLDLLGKVWGFLKYYHPAVAAGNYNWDFELFRILPRVLEAKNQKELNAILNKWVVSLGKLESAKEEVVKQEIKIRPDFSWMDKKALGSELTLSLEEVRKAKRSSENYYIGRVANVLNAEFKHEQPYGAMNYHDEGLRLLCLYRYWNIIQYFFPYKNLIEEDWNKVLTEFIPKFVKADNELDYKLTVLALIARIHDTHANILGMDNTLSYYKGRKYTPIEIGFVENKAVVIDYFDKNRGERSGLKIGDVVEKINGSSVEEIVKEKLALTPASNYPTQLRDIARDLLRSNGFSISIEYWNGTEKLPAQLNAYNDWEINLYAKYQKKDTCFKMIDKGIAYLYPGSVKNECLPKIISEIQKSKGLIIDFRCYPSDFIVFSLGEHLLPKATSFAKLSTGSITSPGLFTMTDEIKVGKDNPDFFKGKIIIIINETTQSSAEYHTMAFRTAPNATVIGSTTAGADGNVSQFMLPGLINTRISGIGVYYPDGKETQRIGIIPDFEVKPTIKGIKERKDEVLERAIKLINEK